MPILSVESRLVHFLEFVFELIVLNFLTLIFFIPIVTVGVATTSLYRSLFDIRQGKGNIIKGYLAAFIENIRPGLVLGLILILTCISLFLYVVLLQGMIAADDVVVFGGLILVAIIFFFPMTFAFPLLAMFDNPVLTTLSNAFYLSFRHVGTTLVVLLLYGLPWLLLILSPALFLKGLFLFIMFGLSLPGWFASDLFLRVFRKYSENI